MKDHPIIFSGEMVRVLLSGRKTMTRRLASSPLRRARPGDRLWVRENVKLRSVGPLPGEVSLIYQADTDQMSAPIYDRFTKPGDKNRLKFTGWTPSIHMPRWASRITLLLDSVKTEPLQTISDADAKSEGCTSRDDFCELWTRLHGNHGRECWVLDPLIVALSFRLEEINIDQQGATP